MDEEKLKKRQTMYWIIRGVFILAIIVAGIRAYWGNDVTRNSVVKTAEVIDEGHIYHETDYQYDQTTNQHEYETKWYQAIKVQFDVEGEKKETDLEIEVDSDTSSWDPEPVDDDIEMEYKKGDNVEIYVNESNWAEAYVKESIDIEKNVAIGFLLTSVVAWIVVEIVWFIRRKKSEKQS